MISIKVIYHCFGGSHSSALAANIHVGNAKSDSFPRWEQLFSLPYFDRTTDEDFGVVKLVGFDEWGNQVYCLGQMHLGTRFHSTMETLATITGIRDIAIMAGTMPEVNLLMMAGGNLSRRRSAPSLGRPLIYWGTRLAYPSLCRVVRETKNKLLLRG